MASEHFKEPSVPIQTFTFSIDQNVHSLETIQKVCYTLAADYSFDISSDSGSYHITVSMNKPANEQEFRHQFNRLLLDYALRERIAEETGELKADLLRLALSSLRRPNHE